MDAIPIDPLTAGVVVIGTLSVIAALYFGKEVILPIALAIVLKLLLQPIVDGLCSILRIPTVVGALILISCLCAGLGAVGFIVSGPASGWIQKAPEVLPALKEKLVLLREPIEYLQKSFKEIEEVATTPPRANDKPPPVAVKDQSEIAGSLQPQRSMR